MKKTLCVLLTMLLLLFSSACSTATHTEGPSETVLQNDLQTSLVEYRVEDNLYPLPLKEYHIEKSLTEENSYTAEIKVIANSMYAEYEYLANVVYTLYDQGWAIDSCDWTSYGYEVVNYPNEDQLTDLENRNDIQTLSSPMMRGDGPYFKVTGTQTIDWSSYVEFNGQCTLLWYYNDQYDCWDYYRKDYEQTECVLTKDFEAVWGKSIGSIEVDNGSFSVDDILVELKSSNLHQDEITLVFESSRDFELSRRVVITIFREPKSIDGRRYDMEIVIGKTKGDTTSVDYKYHYVN